LLTLSALFLSLSAAQNEMPAGGVLPALHHMQQTNRKSVQKKYKQAYYNLKESSQKQRLWELKG
jgi:hypothetical protein